MIIKLGIQDFQSIEKMAVECGPITVFVGESDSGKSAVVRALYAASFNDYPSDHVREGQSDSKVVVADDAGMVAVAEKGKTKNVYRLSGQGDSKQWERVGRDVPEEVAEVLGWRVLELDDGTKFAPSIQRQFDGPFLLADSPSRVAKVLGSLTNISTLFAAIREGTNQERRFRQAADAAAEEAERHNADLEASIEEAEAAQSRAERARTALQAVEDCYGELERVVALSEALEVSWGAVGELQARFEEAKSRVVEVPDLEEQFQELHNLEVLEVNLEHASKAVTSAMREHQQAQIEFEKAQGDLEAYMETLEVCPVCERPMHDEDHE